MGAELTLCQVYHLCSSDHQNENDKSESNCVASLLAENITQRSSYKDKGLSVSVYSRFKIFICAIAKQLGSVQNDTQGRIWCGTAQKHTNQGSSTNLRHLRKPVELRMLLRPILLQVVRYSEYISDRDTEPSGVASKCAFSLMEEEKDD